MAVKNKNNFFLIGLASLIVVFIAYLSWFVISGNDQTADDYSLGNFQVIKAEDLGLLRKLKACGNWPVMASANSEGRGSPFSRGAVTLPLTAASSTPECLPVGNN